MAKITGIGGIFFRAKTDDKALRAWYTEKLGIAEQWEGGTTFPWLEKEEPHAEGCTVWSVFKPEGTYFGDSGQSFMINYRVDNLDEYLQELESKGVEIIDRKDQDEYGKFAWIHDADGNRIELWQPAPEEQK